MCPGVPPPPAGSASPDAAPPVGGPYKRRRSLALRLPQQRPARERERHQPPPSPTSQRERAQREREREIAPPPSPPPPPTTTVGGVQLVPARGALPAFSARGQPVVPVRFQAPGEHNRFAPLFDLEVVDLDDGVDAAAADDKKQPEKKTTRQRPRRSPRCTDDAPVQKTSRLGLVGAFGILYATTAAVRAALRLALPRPVAHAFAASYRTLTVHGNNPGFFAPLACGGARIGLVILACTAAVRVLRPLANQPRRDLLASGAALLALAVATALVGAGLT